MLNVDIRNPPLCFLLQISDRQQEKERMEILRSTDNNMPDNSLLLVFNYSSVCGSE